VKSLGAEKAFNYDADCGEQIRKYTNNNLKYAWDCIGVGDAIKICADALTSGPGAKYASLLLTKFSREDVESTNTLADSALGELFDNGFAKSEGEAKDYDFQVKTWIPVVEKLLAEGKVSGENWYIGCSAGLWWSGPPSSVCNDRNEKCFLIVMVRIVRGGPAITKQFSVSCKKYF
jgi:hypothetical protein